MGTHAQFEELCTLATSGQLTADEARLLDTHLAQCQECRQFLSQARTLSDTMLPRILPASRREAPPPAGMRERFLARAAEQGLMINPGPAIAIAMPPPVLASEPQPFHEAAEPETNHLTRSYAWKLGPPVWKPLMLATGSCALCFFLGTQLRRPAAANSPAFPSTPKVAMIAPPADNTSPEMLALTAERDRLSQEHAQLSPKLDVVNQEKQSTAAALQRKIDSLTSAASDAQHEHQTLVEQNAALNQKAQTLEAQLDTLKQKQSATEAVLLVQEQETKKYASLASTLATQRTHPNESDARSQLSPKDASEVGDLVAARNLHIIDVYDADTEGNRQKAFGRVFYVEGRSLVFYAYDLAKVHAEKRVTFHVWGAHSNDKGVTLSLGVLKDEDSGEQRWALTYDDPKVLAKINSVFVTIEPSNKDVTAPTGKTVLYAYLGGKANHP